MSGRPQRQNLWGPAFDLLSPKEQSCIRYDVSKTNSTAKDITIVEATLQAIQDKRKLCMQKRWTFTTISGRRIIIRDVLDKIATWLNRFKEVGDLLMQYDPSYAALPWAAIRFLLQASVNDIETFTTMAERLETVARLIARYSIFEAVYLATDAENLFAAQDKLFDALVLLYAECLRHLVDIKQYHDRTTKKRIVQSILRSSAEIGDNNRVKSIATKEEEVERLAQIVQTERIMHLNGLIKTSEDKSQQSLQSLEALLRSLTAPVLRLSDPLTLLQDTLQEAERRKFLLWLSGHNYRQYHESTYKEIVPGTCRWIFDKFEYQDWQSSSVCSILWLHGIPGCGKTKLTSSVIQHHLDYTQNNDRSCPVAWQLAETHKTIRRPVWEEYTRRQEAAEMDGFESSPLTAEECLQLLLTLMIDSPATIIIDGLDELVTQRIDLIMALKTLIQESSNVIKIMISSREELDILQELRDYNSADIELFVKEKVNLAIANRQILGGSVSEALKDHLMHALLDGAKGMFLWPAMQLEFLSDRNKFKVEADIIDALKSLPPTLVKTFDRLYTRITEYEYHAKNAATRALAWLLAAERTLSVSELLTAIRLERGGETFENTNTTDSKYDAQTILDLCCNFLTLDKDTGQFSFVHASVREYLLQLPEYSLSAINFAAAMRCLACFMFDDEDTASESWSNEDKAGDTEYADSSFREYAICHWAHHFKEFVSEKETATFQQWLEDVREMVESRRSKELKASNVKELHAIPNNSNSPLFVACVYGLPTILDQMEGEVLESGRRIDYNVKNSHGTSAVYISARYGHAVVLKRLLEYGANVDEDGGLFGKPLQAAAFHGYLDVVQILIQRGANVFSPGKFTSALEAAMFGGNEKVIEFLLKASNITEKQELEKILTRASYDGHDEVVGYILDLLYPSVEDTSTRETSNNFHDTLQVALFQCRPRIVRRMLKQVIKDINIDIGHFGNALQAAAFGGHATMVLTVLQHGADINQRGRYGTALRASALRGHDTIVKLLVDCGASIGGTDADAIQAAAFNGHFSTVQLLLTCGLYDVGHFSFQIRPAVDAACFRGYIDVARLFLQTYQSKCAPDDDDCATCAFFAALNGGRENIVQLALQYNPVIRDPEDLGKMIVYLAGGERGLNLLPIDPPFGIWCESHPSEDSKSTGNPHQQAMQHEKDNISYAKLDGLLPWRLIDDRIEAVPSSGQFRIPMIANEDICHGNGRFLRLAARHGFIGTIQHLLDQGDDINTTGDKEGGYSHQSSPIEVASAAGQTQVVEFLLANNAKVGKALSHAVRNQKPAVIGLLFQYYPDLPLDDPVSLEGPQDHGRSTSAIAVAVEWNFPDMLAILLSHAKNTQGFAIGCGLVVAVQKRYIDLLQSILCGFQLMDAWDSYSPFDIRQCHAFVVAVIMAVRERNMIALQVLMSHIPPHALKEQFLSLFAREGVIKDNWHESLQEIKTAFAPSFYERLAGKTLVTMAAFNERWWKQEDLKKGKSILLKEISRVSEISPISSSLAREALIEASKSQNIEIIRLLLGQHGEHEIHIQDPITSWIDQSYADGHTALYHACTTGCPKMFSALLQAGASLYTFHTPYPMHFFSENGENLEDQRPAKVNLLQVAVDACLASWRRAYGITIWEKPLKESWGPIACSLLDNGVKLDLNSLSLKTFFYISCFQGELLYVEKLLEQGISLVGPSGSTKEERFYFDSALHAAVLAGHKAVADSLLSHGADVHYRAESKEGKNQTAVQACWGTDYQRISWNISMRKRDQEVVEDRYWDKIFKICVYLIELGGNEADAEAVLYGACRRENLEIVKQMLLRRTRLQTLPDTISVDLFHTFVDSGHDFHSQPSFIAKLQVRAIKKGNVKFFSKLVEDYGLQHRFDAFSDCGQAIIFCRGDRAPILRYLVEKCSFNIDSVYPSGPGPAGMVTLLYQAACFGRSDFCSLLLKQGADPDCPGIPYTPLLGCLTQYSFDVIPKVTTLLDFGADVNGSRMADREPDGRLKANFDPTPLVRAIGRGLIEVVQILVNNGADINHGQIPPLRLARFYRCLEIENLLVRHGAVDDSDPTCSVSEYMRDVRINMDEFDW